MKFTTVQEAFNFYADKTPEDIEKRSSEIKNLINTDPTADVDALNIEIQGMRQAKDNMNDRTGKQRETQKRSALDMLNVISGSRVNGPATTLTAENVLDSAEYRSAFCKNFLGQRLNAQEQEAFNLARTNQRASVFGNLSDSAAVVPTQMLNEIISKARDEGGLLAACRAFNIPSNISVPVGTPGTVAAWHTEGATVDTEKVAPTSVIFNGYELMKIFSLSVAAQTMSISAFESYITDELNSCIMRAIDSSAVTGTGTNQPKGIDKITFGAANSLTYTHGAKPTYDSFTDMMGKLKRGYSAGASWAMNNATLYTHVYGLKDGNGRPIFIQDPKTEGIGYILGKPVIIDDNISDGVIYLGNFSYYGYNIPSGIVIEADRSSSFKQGLIDFRAMAVCDAKPIVEEAFCKLSEATA